MAVTVGSARSSYGNTSAGDQHNGLEVSTQSYYVHSLGWRVFRAVKPEKRHLLAKAMRNACDNNSIGYSQGSRNTLTENVKPYGYDPAKTTKKVNTDCSALVRCCCLYAGISVGDFITSNLPSKLLGTGEFVELKGDKYTKQSAYLCEGDVLCTKSKGHTVIVLTSGSKCEDVVKEISYALGDRELKNGCEGEDVKELQTALIDLGYSCGDWGVDGDFGDDTEMAVKNFQRDHGLVVDGVAGATTMKAIKNAIGSDGGNPSGFTRVNIVGGNCYVRTEPNTSGKVLGTAHKDTSYVYGGEISDAGWYKILYNGSLGWVSGKYAKAEG